MGLTELNENGTHKKGYIPEVSAHTPMESCNELSCWVYLASSNISSLGTLDKKSMSSLLATVSGRTNFLLNLFSPQTMIKTLNINNKIIWFLQRVLGRVK